MDFDYLLLGVCVDFHRLFRGPALFMKCFLDFPTLAGKIVIIITSWDASSENLQYIFTNKFP